MSNSKQPEGKYALLILNCMTTTSGLGSGLFTLALLFMATVSLISRKTDELPSIIGSPLHPNSFQEIFWLSLFFFDNALTIGQARVDC